MLLHRFTQWLVFLLLTFLVALAVSWAVLAKVDFAYPWLHDHAGMAQNITQYAPHNPIKPHFDQTTAAERARLFHGIVVAIHQHGQGLAELTYHDASGKPLNTLLTNAEVVHLQDVAHLLDKVKVATLLVMGLWTVMLAGLVYFRQALPSTPQLLLGLLGVSIVSAVVLSLGAVEVFYQLHVWIFPQGHQWFFYYEESLMSMMMKAPDLFGYIAMMLVALALCLSVAMLWAYRGLVSRRG
jgi:hypothetical protein